MDSARGGTWEGLGGPTRMDEYSFDGIDPTLDACCQREVRRRKECAPSHFFFHVFVFDLFRYPTFFADTYTPTPTRTLLMPPA